MRNQLSSVDIPELLRNTSSYLQTNLEMSHMVGWNIVSSYSQGEDLAFDEYIVIELKFGRETILHCIISLSCFQASPPAFDTFYQILGRYILKSMLKIPM